MQCVFDVTPDSDLAIMKPGQTLFDVTCDDLLKLKAVLEDKRPDVVFVHGAHSYQLRGDPCLLLPADSRGDVEASLRTHDIVRFGTLCLRIATCYPFF